MGTRRNLSSLLFFAWALFTLISAPSALAGPAAPSRPMDDLKPRVVILTDLKRVQETDDGQSLVRLLAYADQVEIEALVISSGPNYWTDTHIVEGYELAWELLDAYAASVGNLMKMSGQRGFEVIETAQRVGYWPSANYLRQRVALGKPRVGMEHVGNGKGTDGSRLITSVVDEDDPRPVYVLAWGGPNVLAQAIWDISENPATRRSREAVEAFVRKLRVVAIADQDQPWSRRHEPAIEANAGYWLRRQFPGLSWLRMSPAAFTAASRDRQPFYQAHIQGHGALGDAYPDHAFSIEGDTPALFHVLPLGLSDPERPEWGSLAGVFVKGPHQMETGTSYWHDTVPGRDEVRSLSTELVQRWTAATWNDFAARMDWARAGTGNRPPIAVVNGDASARILEIVAAPGSTVEIDASRSRDDESNRLAFRWSVLALPGTYAGPVAVEHAEDGKIATVRVPADAAGSEIHVLLELTDNGAGHPLTAFRRVVIRPR